MRTEEWFIPFPKIRGGQGGVNKILPLLILGEGWGGVKFIKKPIGTPIGFKYVRVRRFIITYANISANGPFGVATLAATALSSAIFNDGIV